MANSGDLLVFRDRDNGYYAAIPRVPDDFRFTNLFVEAFAKINVIVQLCGQTLIFESATDPWDEQSASWGSYVCSNLLMKLYWERVC